MKKPEFAPTEKLKPTASFSNPNIKVNFIPPQRVEVEKKVDKPDSERKNIIDAVVVRIMKARKTEKHNQLIEDVIKQISIFLAQPPMIKERIENLIEREYLKRDEQDRSKYIYLPWSNKDLVLNYRGSLFLKWFQDLLFFLLLHIAA